MTMALPGIYPIPEVKRRGKVIKVYRNLPLVPIDGQLYPTLSDPSSQLYALFSHQTGFTYYTEAQITKWAQAEGVEPRVVGYLINENGTEQAYTRDRTKPEMTKKLEEIERLILEGQAKLTSREESGVATDSLPPTMLVKEVRHVLYAVTAAFIAAQFFQILLVSAIR